MSFNPSRFALARIRRGITKQLLAEKIGVDVRNVHRFEDGELAPAAETLARIATVLHFPESFFSTSRPPPELPVEWASFRSLSTLTQKRRDSVLAAGQLAIELDELLSNELNLPKSDLPNLRNTAPEEASRTLRSHWGLGSKPISNTVHLLESRGVRVFSLAEDCADIDAFTITHGATPFVFLNVMKSAERGRFDAAHELGHLVLHRHGVATGREAESEADAFASAFLMPSDDVIAHASALPSLTDLVGLKLRWGVSVAALARRLYDLLLIREWHYKQLCIEISRRGYRTSEPEGLPRETSLLLRKSFDLLRTQKNMSRRDIAERLHVTVEEHDALVFGLVLSGVRGGGQFSGPRRGNAVLRQVK